MALAAGHLLFSHGGGDDGEKATTADDGIRARARSLSPAAEWRGEKGGKRKKGATPRRRGRGERSRRRLAAGGGRRFWLSGGRCCRA